MLKDGDFNEGMEAIEASYSTDYEIERNNPLPNIIHGRIQHKISKGIDFQLTMPTLPYN